MAEKIAQYAEEYKFAISDAMEMGVKISSPFGKHFILCWIMFVNHFNFRASQVSRMGQKIEYITG